jgi:hypothetical protein
MASAPECRGEQDQDAGDEQDAHAPIVSPAASGSVHDPVPAIRLRWGP